MSGSKFKFDVVIAGTVILLLSPMLLAVAVGVRLSTKSRVLFKQKRYGLDGRPIIVYKFRSMTVAEDGESTYTQVSRNDARVTVRTSIPSISTAPEPAS